MYETNNVALLVVKQKLQKDTREENTVIHSKLGTLIHKSQPKEY
jgi:hypothetical protein